MKDGWLVKRKDAPNDAYQVAFTRPGVTIEGADPSRDYEVWAVER